MALDEDAPKKKKAWRKREREREREREELGEERGGDWSIY